MARKVKGRRKGSRNKGYFYRSSHKVWVAQVGGRMIPLTDQAGNRIRDPEAAKAILEDAYARFRLTLPQQQSAGDRPTLHQLAAAYLKSINQTNGAKATLQYRKAVLYDLCEGFGAKWLGKEKHAKPSDRIHDGYGSMAAEDLRPHHVYDWLSKHPGWGQGATRMSIQAIRRMLCYGKECGLLKENPIKGIRIPKGRARITCLSPEQEQALLKVSRLQLRTAIRVLIRTGMRPGEFVNLTAVHVIDRGERMEFQLKAGEVKTRHARTVRLTDPEIMELVRYGMKHHKSGPIFRTIEDKPWEVKNLSRSFFRALKRATKRLKVTFDADCVLYSTRHTYAKRILTGYWNSRPVNIEVLAKLMGNTPKVCRDNYLQWSDSYEQPLWDAVA